MPASPPSPLTPPPPALGVYPHDARHCPELPAHSVTAAEFRQRSCLNSGFIRLHIRTSELGALNSPNATFSTLSHSQSGSRLRIVWQSSTRGSKATTSPWSPTSPQNNSLILALSRSDIPHYVARPYSLSQRVARLIVGIRAAPKPNEIKQASHTHLPLLHRP